MTPADMLSIGPAAELPVYPSDVLSARLDYTSEGDAAIFGSRESAAAEQRRQGFEVGVLRLMVRYEDGSELSELDGLSRLPESPPWLLGVVNLHGVLLPVFDLAARFGVGARNSASKYLLVIGHGPDAAGVMVDGIPRRLKWQGGYEAADDAIPPELVPVTQGAVMIENALWLDLSAAALLDALEHSLASPHAPPAR